ncbi:MAG TPA: COX15/CtaA family protein [Chloroflexota bacterium]|nr:COX15/CtaA family protein [Chloroflexota bacterium]
MSPGLPLRDRALRWLAVAATIGMLLVLVMGAAVTNTGSAEGCGRSWPLCNGQFVPEFTVATAIEYSHRAVSGIEGVLVLALAAVMLARWRTEREVQVLAPLMLGTLLLQAGLGAGAVMLPQSPAVLASHFGVSLIAFASTFLACVVVFERTCASFQRADVAAAPPPPVPAGFRLAVLGVGLYVMLVVYLGAYVRHAGVSLACADWPLCNGQVVPPLDGPTGIVFAHRVGAVGALMLLLWLATRAQAVRVGIAIAWLAFALAIAQALSGAFVVTTRLSLFSTLGHAAIMAMLFASLALLTRRVLVTDLTTPADREVSAGYTYKPSAPAATVGKG